jgi:mannose-6-phosphate isomerase-like protein (cupin superfamily)
VTVIPESKLRRTRHGLIPGGEGWFVLNLRDAMWRHAEGRGAVSVALDDFEGRRTSAQLGVNVFVLGPGEPMAMYHREADQEDFLVVSGAATLVVEGEERPLRAWDFVHCPPGTRHVIVGAGEGNCVVVAVGAREHDGHPGSLGFPADVVAQRHGASVEADTMDGGAAYSSVPGREPAAYRDGWLPG